MARPRAMLLALTAALSIFAGCEQARLDQETFDQIKVGMTYEEVKAILGRDGVDETPSGTSISGAGVASGASAPEKLYVWKDKDRSIAVNIKDGKVTNITKFGF